MEYTVSKNSATTTMFSPSNPDSDSPVYKVSSEWILLWPKKTTVQKIEHAQWREMGTIEMKSFASDIVQIWGKDLDLHRDNILQ